eukprot:2004978-Rhodomonas_salina.1
MLKLTNWSGTDVGLTHMAELGEQPCSSMESKIAMSSACAAVSPTSSPASASPSVYIEHRCTSVL